MTAQTHPHDSADHDLLALPVRVTWLGETPMLEWRRLGLSAARGAMFEDAVKGARITRLEPLDGLDEAAGPGPLAGAIHHTWRCGSTLLCAQFNAVPRTIALSEPYLFSNLLVGREQPPALAAARIRKLAGALGGALAGVADRVVIKWPGLLAQHAAALEAALPEVRGIFMHRDPAAVVASLVRQPLGPVLGLARRYLGDLPPGIDPDGLLGTAHLIAASCRGAARARHLRRCCYAQLPQAAWTGIAPWFGIPLAEQAQAAMAEAALWHSKRPPGARRFTGDPAWSFTQHDRAEVEAAIAVIDAGLTTVKASLTPL